MLTENVQFVVLRASEYEEATAAIVSATVTEDLADEASLLDAIRRAVTAWMKTTEAGREAYIGTVADFNVGDFETYRDEKLDELLRNRGVFSLNVLCVSASDCGSWVFDDLLFNSGDIEDDN